jgi:septum formation protein
MILVSASPRRQEILRKAGYSFRVSAVEIEEKYPVQTAPELVPEYLAKLKIDAIKDKYPDTLLISADTIVLLDGKILGKPANAEEAREMLEQLSGRTHRVITGVCMYRRTAYKLFSAATEVRFVTLDADEIDYYVQSCMPVDKAGAYGIQEWIGMIGVDHVEGSFYNVMGLPVHKLYAALKEWGILPTETLHT